MAPNGFFIEEQTVEKSQHSCECNRDGWESPRKIHEERDIWTCWCRAIERVTRRRERDQPVYPIPRGLGICKFGTSRSPAFF